jgi:hypothetical protein
MKLLRVKKDYHPPHISGKRRRLPKFQCEIWCVLTGGEQKKTVRLPARQTDSVARAEPKSFSLLHVLEILYSRLLHKRYACRMAREAFCSDICVTAPQ